MPAKQRGFTLSELLCVLAILLVVASISYPVFVHTKAKAKETVCVEKLRQIGMALSMYRANAEGIDQPATTTEMGLPNYFGPTELASALGGPPSAYYKIFDCESGLSYPNGGASGEHGFFQLWPSSFGRPVGSTVSSAEQQSWIKAVSKGGGATVVLSDPNHQPTWPATPYSTQYAFGVTLDGSIRKQFRRGDSSVLTWWQ